MLAVVVVAALVPNAGTVSAASNCPYGNCPPTSSSFPAWEIASIGAIIVLGLLVGLFVLMRRRRPPPSEGMAAAGGSGGVPPSGATQTGPGGPYTEENTATSYVETPEDVAGPQPNLVGPAVGAAGGAAAGAGAESEPDIDSLMAELDKISGEILKRTPKKGSQSAADEDTDSSSP